MGETALRRWISGPCAPTPGCPLSGGWTRCTGASWKVIERTKPEVLAIEKLFYQHNQTTVIGVAEARGVILLAAAQAGLPIYEYTPMQVKQAVTGYGKAVKKQVQEMTRVLLHLPAVPKPDDTADALAMAITFCHTNGNQLNRFVRRGVGPI